jgi:hypothetical protein
LQHAKIGGVNYLMQICFKCAWPAAKCNFTVSVSTLNFIFYEKGDVTGCLAAMWALYRLGLSLVGCSVGSAQRKANGRTHRVTTSGRKTSARVATAFVTLQY